MKNTRYSVHIIFNQHNVLNVVDHYNILSNVSAIMASGDPIVAEKAGGLTQAGNLVMVYCCLCQVKANSFWWSLRYREKSLDQVITAYQVPGDMLIFFSKNTTYCRSPPGKVYKDPQPFSKIH